MLLTLLRDGGRLPAQAAKLTTLQRLAESTAIRILAAHRLQQHLDDASTETRLRTLLLTLFAVTAVLLACIGLYGTMSYLARLRKREVGVRLALRALRGQILGSFLGQGLRVAGIGCVAGVLLGLGLSRFLSGMLYGITALDPLTYASVVGLVLLVAILASLLPAVRAAQIEPVRVLREEPVRVLREE